MGMLLKRSWKKYDVEMKKWKNIKVKNKLKKDMIVTNIIF